MAAKKVFICGNFGYLTNQLDGQTVKTRVLKDELNKRLGSEHISYTDTSYLKSNALSVIFRIIKNFIRNSHLIIMPDTKAFKFLVPFFVLFKRNRDIRYVVIGGWLPDYLRGNAFYTKLVSKLDKVYVESKAMKDALENIGLTNVEILHNFRYFDQQPIRTSEPEEPYRFIFFSRVIKEKGVDLAIHAVRRINHEFGKEVIRLDIYGPVQKDYEEELRNLMAGDSVVYKGMLQQNEIHRTLAHYDVMVFPTYYSAEGFPGVIIDAYISGLPVIASNWKYNGEFVVDGKTGLLFETNNLDDLCDKIKYLINNRHVLLNMRMNCYQEAWKYHADNVIPEIINDWK